jgi:hypothetical protein
MSDSQYVVIRQDGSLSANVVYVGDDLWIALRKLRILRASLGESETAHVAECVGENYTILAYASGVGQFAESALA